MRPAVLFLSVAMVAGPAAAEAWSADKVIERVGQMLEPHRIEWHRNGERLSLVVDHEE